MVKNGKTMPRDNNSSKKTLEKELSLREKIIKRSDSACRITKHLFGISLDYSNRSIELLEEIFNEWERQKKYYKEPLSEEDYIKRATAFGCYMGETLIRNLKKGKWFYDEKQDCLGVKIDQLEAFFPDKVYKRLKKGPGENVVLMYQEAYNILAGKPIKLRFSRQRVLNLAVKTNEPKAVKSILSKQEVQAYLANEPINGWLAVFPNETKTDLEKLTEALSSGLKTIVILGSVATGDFFLKIYDKGILVFTTSDRIDFDEKADEMVLKTISDGTSKLPNCLQGEKSIKEIDAFLQKEYVFLEDKYADFCQWLGAPKFLKNWTFAYISEDKKSNYFEESVKKGEAPSVVLFP
jgi:predicted nucleotidyltransferase